MHGQRPGVDRGGVAPHALHDLVAREHAPRVPRQERQEVELARGQANVASTYAYLARGQVDLELAEHEHVGRGLSAGAPQDGSHPRHQLARRERLRHVVVGAELEAHDAVRLLAARRQQDHGSRAARADRATQLQPADAREHDVEDDQVGDSRSTRPVTSRPSAAVSTRKPSRVRY